MGWSIPNINSDSQVPTKWPNAEPNTKEGANSPPGAPELAAIIVRIKWAVNTKALVSQDNSPLKINCLIPVLFLKERGNNDTIKPDNNPATAMRWGNPQRNTRRLNFDPEIILRLKIAPKTPAKIPNRINNGISLA